MPSEETQFKQGNPGGPGRPPGGRRITLDRLDAMLAKAENVKRFDEALQQGFEKDPLVFWRQYVFPLLPQKLALTDPSGEEERSVFSDRELVERFQFALSELSAGNGKTNKTK